MSEVEVTREHREAAVRALVPGIVGGIEVDWARLGDEHVGYIPVVASRIAQALAAAELRGKRAALLELHELMRRGPDQRTAYAALVRLSFEYGAMREVDGIATIGEFQPTEGETPR